MFGAAVLLPLVLTAGYSFTEWDGFGPMTFVGLDNYARALDDELFRGSFVHVLIYIAATLVLEVGVGLGLAGLIDLRRRNIWFRVAIFTPVMLPMVVVAVLWSFIYNPDFGLINGGLEAVGPGAAPAHLAGRSADRAAGHQRRLGLGLRRLLHDDLLRRHAAGAHRGHRGGAPRRRRRVGPLPARQGAHDPRRHRVAVLLCVTGGFQGFDLFFVLTNGGPYGTTEIPTTLLVKTVFRNGDVGYGSAMAVLLTAVVVGVGIVYARLQARRRVRSRRDAGGRRR